VPKAEAVNVKVLPTELPVLLGCTVNPGGVRVVLTETKFVLLQAPNTLLEIAQKYAPWSEPLKLGMKYVWAFAPGTGFVTPPEI
jgi:hypothetical protein